MEMQVFPANPKLRTLLLILIFTFAASGIALAVLAQIQAYNREQIYLATEAALPRHREETSIGRPSTALGTTLSETQEWKTYRNEEFGFELKYPADWNSLARKDSVVLFDDSNVEIGEDVGIVVFLRNSAWVLEIDKSNYIEKINKLSLKDIAENEIDINGCPGSEEQPGDHYIGDFKGGSLYVLFCSAGSESYYFLVRNPNGELFKLRYHDDWGSNDSEIGIIENFKIILSTFKFIK